MFLEYIDKRVVSVIPLLSARDVDIDHSVGAASALNMLVQQACRRTLKRQ
jgi:hypothetical protein